MIPMIINIDSSVERREQIKKQLDEQGTTYMIVDAINGLNLECEQYRLKVSKMLDIPEEKLRPSYFLCKKNFQSMCKKWKSLAPRVGCFLSHYKCLKLAYDHDMIQACILEDDIEILKNLNEIKTPFLNTDYDIQYLGGSARPLPYWTAKGYYDCKEIELYGTFGYMIGNQFSIMKIYKGLRSCFDEGTRKMTYHPSHRLSASNIDNFYKRYFHKYSVALYPPYVKHKDEIESTIDKSKKYKNRYGLKCMSVVDITDI